MKKKLLDLGCEIAQDGDSEGNFLVDTGKARHIAILIGANKNNVSKENRKKMKERMQQRWARIKGEIHA